MRILTAALFAIVLSFTGANAQGLTPDMGFMPTDEQVTLLNKSGKRQVVESLKDFSKLWKTKQFQRVEHGTKCQMKKGSLIMLVGVGENPHLVRVRYMFVPTTKGHCPFWTEFDMDKMEFEIAKKLYELKSESGV